MFSAVSFMQLEGLMVRFASKVHSKGVGKKLYQLVYRATISNVPVFAHFAKTSERLFVERHTRVGTPTDSELMNAAAGGPEAAFSVGTTQNFAADKDPMLGLALVRRFQIPT